LARAIIPAFALTFNQPDISDDATNGWKARFQVFYLGDGASGGFMVDTFEVHFADTDLAQAMKTKMRDAARARATELNVTGASTMPVTSMIAPERL
jgi:hypothetical protein